MFHVKQPVARSRHFRSRALARQAGWTVRDGRGAQPLYVSGPQGCVSGLDAALMPRYSGLMQEWLRTQLEGLSMAGLLRDPADARAREVAAPAGSEPAWLDACSNDYLGLGARGVSRETLASLEGLRAGAGASRLVQGTFAEHEELEADLAQWTGLPASLLCTSAFAANTGLLPALAGAGALIVSDALNHASIVDGCRLAAARVVVTPHLELAAVEQALRGRVGAGPAWVVTEALFSMDGDQPDLRELRGLCDRYGAGLVVDEAHSLGVLGPEGGGAGRAAQVQPDVLVAGLGKAVGAQGGFVAGPLELRKLLWNRLRSFVFSTAPSPLLSRLARHQVRAAREAHAERRQLARHAEALRAALRQRGLPLMSSAAGPIVPLLLGSNERALEVMFSLRQAGILVQAIRPPTVPDGSARLRLTVHADWPDDAVERLANQLEQACAS